MKNDDTWKKIITTPITDEIIRSLHVGDFLTLSGFIYCGRDAVLPKLVELINSDGIENNGIDLNGSAIFHTAVSPAGVGPTSSNKLEIESSMGPLSKAGVKLHIGKGQIKKETVQLLDKYHSVYAVIPPITAILTDRIEEREAVAFPELGMEAFYRLKVFDYPMIIAAAHGESIYEE